MSDIISEYKYTDIVLENDDNKKQKKYIKLPREIVQLQKIYCNKDEFSKLKKSGNNVTYRNKKIGKEIVTTYYKIYAKKIYGYNYRKKILERLFRSKIFNDFIEESVIEEVDNDGNVVNEIVVENYVDNIYKFLEYQFRQNAHKDVDDALKDKYAVLLDRMATYLLTHNKKSEIVENVDSYNKKQIDFEGIYAKLNKKRDSKQKKKMGQHKFNKWKDKYAGQYNRLVNTRFSKLNQIYKNLNVSDKGCWAVVDAENCFEFDGINFKIDDSVTAYKADMDSNSLMDKILCLYDLDKQDYIFYDQDINYIERNLVNKI